jgi:hypothetical protein
VTAIGLWRQGAFYARDALILALASGALIACSLVVGIDRRAIWVLGSGAGLVLCWLLSAVRMGDVQRFLPLGASMLAFIAAFLTVRQLDQGLRTLSCWLLSGLGAASAAIGLVATVFRSSPWAMPAQHLWRLSTTLTYADAAGLLFAMSLLVALGLDQGRWPARLILALCTAGLVATQARGAVLAVIAGLCLVPLLALRRSAVVLLLGLVAGLCVVATSAGHRHHPLAGLLVLGLLLVASWLDSPSMLDRVPRLPWRAIVPIVSVAAIVGILVLHTSLQRRIQTGSTVDRLVEWRAAFAQWRSQPWLGVGPDRMLRFHAADGDYAHFAHNEYLQIAADAGLLGFSLLLATVASVVRALRRVDLVSSCALGALVAFGLGGALDYSWHLAALGLVGGWAAGLAGSAERPDSLMASAQRAGGYGRLDAREQAEDASDGR